MAEWFKAPVLKTDVRDERTMGSNPIPSVYWFNVTQARLISPFLPSVYICFFLGRVNSVFMDDLYLRHLMQLERVCLDSTSCKCSQVYAIANPDKISPSTGRQNQ